MPRAADGGSVLAMNHEPVALTIGGHLYRVVASASPERLQELAHVVDGKLRELNAVNHPNGILLAALALANDVQRLQREHAQLTERSEQVLQGLLAKIDTALGSVDENGEPLEPVASHRAENSR